MPYVYSEVAQLENHELVGSGSCVSLIQHFSSVPNHRVWKEGSQVKGNLMIKVGTAVATFEDGKYPNRDHGNHAAFYMGQDAGGVFVMDQWVRKGKISKRRMGFRGKNADGSYIAASDNGAALSIIE